MKRGLRVRASVPEGAESLGALSLSCGGALWWGLLFPSPAQHMGLEGDFVALAVSVGP